MKKIIFAISIFCSMSVSIMAQGVWTQMNDFTGGIRYFGMGCSVNGKGYIGFGNDGTNIHNDIWEYNPSTDSWTQKAVSPAQPMITPVCWVLNNLIYVGSGANSSNIYDTFFIFNPSTNSWSTCNAPFSSARYESAFFTINNKGYVGTGYNSSSLYDMWEFDPSNNTWTQMADMPSPTGERFATGFSVGSKGYIATGVDQTNTRLQTLYEFDPSNNSWATKASLPAAGRSGPSSIGLNNYGFIIGGAGGATSSSFSINDCWKFDPINNTWTAMASLPSNEARNDHSSFSIGNDIYVVGGDRFGTPNVYLKDVWKFSPFSTGINESKNENSFLVINSKSELIIQYQNNLSLQNLSCKIYSIDGKLMSNSYFISNEISIDKTNFSKGLYIIQINDGKGFQVFTQKIAL